jgi:hypothetical protein
LDEIERQVEAYENVYGLTDRREFDGEFFVPQEIRNRVNANKGSLRIHGGLLTISRSRTFLSLSNGSRSSIHSSTPDLSRSVPNTPGSNHKLSLTSSYDSVLEENEGDEVIIVKKGKGKDKKTKGKHVQHIFSSNINSDTRRKSEDRLLESSCGSFSSLIAVQKQQQQSSDQAFRLIPRVKQSVDVTETSKFSSSTSKSMAALNSEAIVRTQWGRVRGSNSFATDLNISSLSTYTIPRVSLSLHNKLNDSTTAPPRKSLPENRTSSTFIMRHNTDDSAA